MLTDDLDIFKSIPADFQVPRSEEAIIASLPVAVFCATPEEAAPGGIKVAPSQEVRTWLTNYKGTFDFYLSVKQQLWDKGVLSPSQIASIEKAIKRDAEYKAKPLAVIQATIAPSQVLQLKKWLAVKLAEEWQMPMVWRNVSVVEVYRETPAAWQLKVKLTADIARVCHICGLGLTNKISRATGIGPICADNFGIERVDAEDADKVLAKLREFVNVQKIIGPIWLPKSQVKVITDEQ